MSTARRPRPQVAPTPASPFEWDELVKESTRVVLEFFQSESADSMSIGRARIATSVLSSYTRHEQTESARAATAVAIGRIVTTNPAEFAAYLNASMPQLKVPMPNALALDTPAKE